jgi:hypothetical protein
MSKQEMAPLEMVPPEPKEVYKNVPRPEQVKILQPSGKSVYEELEREELPRRQEEIKLENAKKEQKEQIEKSEKFELAMCVLLERFCGMTEEMQIMRKDIEWLLADYRKRAKELGLTESDAERLKKLEEKLHPEMKGRELG